MDIELRGLDELMAKLGKVIAAETLRPGMERAVLFVQGQMQEYPPPPGGSTYRRTGTLGRRWTKSVTVSGGNVQGKVGNNTKYGPWVQSKQFQSRVHRGRWMTDEELVESEFAKRRVTEFLQDEIDKALGD